MSILTHFLFPIYKGKIVENVFLSYIRVIIVATSGSLCTIFILTMCSYFELATLYGSCLTD